MAAFSAGPSTAPAPQKRQPLSAADVDAIAILLKLEDTRTLDEATLKSLLDATMHPEVRRRAIQSVGRINDARGKTLLASMHSETDPEILATVVFSIGQLKDADAITWLGGLLSSPATAPVVAQEAARSLGKIRTLESSATLVRYASSVEATKTNSLAIGEALLSIGRFTNPTNPPNAPPVRAPGDVAAVKRWITSSDVEIRWRASWGLFRLRDSEAVPALMQLATDKSAEVRYWAVRGLAPAVVDKSTVSRAQASATLRTAAVKDSDRRVRTEAIRALTQYDDDESFAILLAAIHSPDNWIGVSAAEQMARFRTRSSVIVPELIAATRMIRPLSLRLVSLAQLESLSPSVADEVARSLQSSDSPYAKTTATQTLQRLAAPPGEAGRRGGGGGGGGGTGGGRGNPPERPAKPAAEYRRMVEQWIVPAYNGAPGPRVVWETPRGSIEIELYAGDAPFGVEFLLKVINSGAIVGTEFTRLVPNFVAQQRGINDDPPLRDEVSRRGLTRGNLSWASGGLDTGRPGFTLATAPHPHIEGDFTALGRVVSGMDAVDHLELADTITAARIKK